MWKMLNFSSLANNIKVKKLGTLSHTFNPSTWEAEFGFNSYFQNSHKHKAPQRKKSNETPLFISSYMGGFYSINYILSQATIGLWSLHYENASSQLIQTQIL